MKLLPRNLGALAAICTKDSHRYANGGVRLACGETEYLAESTDGRVLARVTGPYGQEEHYPNMQAVSDAPNGKTDTVVPAKEWKAAFAGVPKRGGEILQHLAVVQGEDVTTMASTDLESVRVLAPRNVEGRFPPTQAVIDQATAGEPVVVVRVDPALMAKLCSLAAEYTDEEHAGMDIAIYGANKPVGFSCKCNGGQEFVGLLMPLSKA